MKAKFIGEKFEVLTNYGFVYSVTEGGWVSANLATIISESRSPYQRQIQQYTPGKEEMHEKNVSALVKEGLAEVEVAK